MFKKHEPPQPPYTEPVAKLLTFGDARVEGVGDRAEHYRALGFDRSHVPELLRIVGDKTFEEASSESLEMWAPIHALRVLGLLGAEEAAAPLARMTSTLAEDDYKLDEWPKTMAALGGGAIARLSEVLNDRQAAIYWRGAAAFALRELALRHPGHRDECAAVLGTFLSRARKHHSTVNGFVVDSLCHLKATQYLPAIHDAYRAFRVDVGLFDWSDVQTVLGIEEPHPEYGSPGKSLETLFGQRANPARARRRR